MKQRCTCSVSRTAPTLFFSLSRSTPFILARPVFFFSSFCSSSFSSSSTSSLPYPSPFPSPPSSSFAISSLPSSFSSSPSSSSSSAFTSSENLSFETLLVNSPLSEHFHGAFSPVSPPLFQTATFSSPSSLESGPYDYSRSGNPTRELLERQLGRLEGGIPQRARCFASGMAALMIITQLSEGAILCSDDAYGGTLRLLGSVLSTRRVIYVDLADLSAVTTILKANRDIKLIMTESPTNPLMKIVDLRTLALLAHQHDALLSVDNTMMSPYLQRPLELGADLVMNSATKFIGGHSDVTGGYVAAQTLELDARIGFLQNATGNALGPFDCWLLLRGLKTLAVRMKHQQASALLVAQHLRHHAKVRCVYFAGLSDHPSHDVHFAQSSGAGPVISFDTENESVSVSFVDALQLFKRAVSFGSVSSSVELPAYHSHASVPRHLRDAGHVTCMPRSLIRISCGLEDVGDLIRDIDRAFASA